VAASLLATFGIYGGALVISFLGGLFPIVSIEVFVIGLAALGRIGTGDVIALAALGATGHQVAKTITYFAGTGAFEHGKLGARVAHVRARIERWNRHPVLVVLLAASIGLPPIYVVGFLAHPLLQVRFWTFTVVCFVGRFGRLVVIAGAPLLFE
jgi:membrane protein YqaA with SNARE-associated domain